MSNVARVAGQAANTLVKPLNVEDVFSTYLYTGTSAAQTITNGIDLAGEGGLVWLKGRSNASNSHLVDTERGSDKYILSNATNAEGTSTSGSDVTSFNSDGFSFGTYFNNINFNNYTYASWTFRKAPKFFDVVTYTGDSVAGRTISHNLGSVPGMIIIKNLGVAVPWAVYHRGMHPTPENYYMNLNENFARAASSSYWNNTAPTSTTVTLGTANRVNATGSTYVAYLFAHNDGDAEFGPDADADIIKCGSYTGTGATDVDVDLGFEPQWVLVKSSSAASTQWLMLDNVRGTVTGGNDNRLFANLTNAEAANDYLEFTSTGFKITGTSGDVATSGATYIYMAIRRGPMAVPESGTDVFAVKRHAGADGPQPAGITSDMLITTNSEVANTERFNFNRLTNGKVLYTSQTFAEGNYSAFLNFGTNNGVNTTGLWGNTSVPIYYHFKRAPNYFDVVAYTGNGTVGRTVSHNLGVAPEMMWVKRRNGANSWAVYHSGIDVDGDGLPETDDINLNTNAAATDQVLSWNDTAPTATHFTVGNGNEVNNSSGTYIAYLFASLDGVSKVGSYTGNGTNQTINCGFSAGARFILIKRTDSTGDWYVWDTERGIVAANDPHLSLNSTAAEVTTDDSIDPDNSGFIVNQVSATNINVSSATYIFYAIA